MLLPGTAWAQGASGIAGVVRDTTCAVLPGVTVEASSPALIEKVRSVVTDDQGLYKIVELRPGTYTVTFTLTGFSTVKREGLELTTGVTATVNADLRVGGLAETITVSGQSPMVDVQNVVQQRVITTAVLETSRMRSPSRAWPRSSRDSRPTPEAQATMWVARSAIYPLGFRSMAVARPTSTSSMTVCGPITQIP
jgi:hypothetical protein